MTILVSRGNPAQSRSSGIMRSGAGAIDEGSSIWELLLVDHTHQSSEISCSALMRAGTELGMIPHQIRQNIGYSRVAKKV